MRGKSNKNLTKRRKSDIKLGKLGICTKQHHKKPEIWLRYLIWKEIRSQEQCTAIDIVWQRRIVIWSDKKLMSWTRQHNIGILKWSLGIYLKKKEAITKKRKEVRQKPAKYTIFGRKKLGNKNHMNIL